MTHHDLQKGLTGLKRDKETAPCTKGFLSFLLASIFLSRLVGFSFDAFSGDNVQHGATCRGGGPAEVGKAGGRAARGFFFLINVRFRFQIFTSLDPWAPKRVPLPAFVILRFSLHNAHFISFSFMFSFRPKTVHFFDTFITFRTFPDQWGSPCANSVSVSMPRVAPPPFVFRFRLQKVRVVRKMQLSFVQRNCFTKAEGARCATIFSNEQDAFLGPWTDRTNWCKPPSP